MELAKIRNKALQAEQLENEALKKPDAQVLSSPPAAEESSAPAQSTATMPSTEVNTAATAEPLVVESKPQPVARPLAASKATKPAFDPLAQIMAGRAAVQASKEQEQEQESDHPIASTDENSALYDEFLCFTLAGEEYGIKISEIKEIIKVRELTEVPRTPDFIDGVLSLRGVIVPVLDMRKRMEMPDGEPSPHQRIIIVKNGGKLTGLRVDRITGVARIAENCCETLPGVLDGTARGFVNGIGRYDASMLILLNLAAVIDFSLDEVQSDA